ncbi:hypothetical protein HRF87_15845 [Bacillus sp. CRN 9]|nr:hypothetical protein [Bacillus sp. CRN 9]
MTGNAPETRALQDEFTKEFVTSQEEVQEGYYQFKSRTDGYTMLFPKEGKVSNASYEKNENLYESLSFGENKQDENLAFYYMITYEDRSITNEIESNLSLLSSYANYERDYEEFEVNDITFYYAEDIYEVEGNKAYNYFTYIKSNNSDQAVRFFARSSCKDFDKKCNPEQEFIKDKFQMMMKSVSFLHS